MDTSDFDSNDINVTIGKALIAALRENVNPKAPVVLMRAFLGGHLDGAVAEQNTP